MDDRAGDRTGADLLDLDVEYEPGASRALVRVEGEVDTASVGELNAVLERVIGAGATDVRLDLDQVPFMDSTGLTALLSARTKLAGRGAVVIDRASPAVRRTVEIAGLDALFIGT